MPLRIDVSIAFGLIEIIFIELYDVISIIAYTGWHTGNGQCCLVRQSKWGILSTYIQHLAPIAFAKMTQMASDSRNGASIITFCIQKYIY